MKAREIEVHLYTSCTEGKWKFVLHRIRQPALSVIAVGVSSLPDHQSRLCACHLTQLHHHHIQSSALQSGDMPDADAELLPSCCATQKKHGLSSVQNLPAMGLCPSCSTTWVKALTKGPVLFEDRGSLPSQSMQLLHLAGDCNCT